VPTVPGAEKAGFDLHPAPGTGNPVEVFNVSFIQREVSIAAGGSNSNLVSGSAFELPRRPMLVSIGVTAAATGTFFTISAGSQLLLEESPPVVATRFPIQPDEMFYNDIMMPGDRLVISARNPTAGAVIHRVIVTMQPIDTGR